MEHTESPTVRAARHNAASFLADALWNAGAHTTEALDRLHDDVWTLAATTAATLENTRAAAEGRTPGWRPTPGYCPSDRTRELVATLISYRARTAAQPEVDPFAGLPS